MRRVASCETFGWWRLSVALAVVLSMAIVVPAFGAGNFAAGVFQRPAFGEESESNDSEIFAEGPLAAGVDYTGAMSGTDEDWYFFHSPSPTTIRITATGEPGAADPCAPNDGLVIKLNGSVDLGSHLLGPDCGKTETMALRIPRRGMYFIRVAGTGPRYRFRIETPEAVTATPVARVASGLTITSARVSHRRGRLELNGRISTLATGTLIARYRSSLGTRAFRYPLIGRMGQISIRQQLPAALLRARGRGVQLQYTGNDPTRGETVSVAVEAAASGLTIVSAELAKAGDGLWHVRARGAVTRRAYQDAIRLLLRGTDSDGFERSQSVHASVERDGSWRYDRPFYIRPKSIVGPLQVSAIYRGSRRARLQGAVSPAALPIIGSVVDATSRVRKSPPRLTRRARLSFDGVGPVKIGMTVREAERAAGIPVRYGQELNSGCARDALITASLGMSMLTRNGRVELVSVDKRGIATNTGIRVGDGFPRLKNAYARGLHRVMSGDDPPDHIRYETTKGSRPISFLVSRSRVRSIETGTSRCSSRFVGEGMLAPSPNDAGM